MDDPLGWLASPRALLVALVLAAVLGVGFYASTSTASFDPFNAGWDGGSQLQGVAEGTGADADVVRGTAAYPTDRPRGAVAVVLSPTEPYSRTDTRRLRAFVRGGGTLLVAEDFGPHANPLLSAVGADARVDGVLVRDERHHYRSPAMPLARNVSNHTLVDGVDQLTLNYGTAVEPNGATVLVATSPYAYRDENRNDRLDDDERLDSYPVATVESVGDGTVIVLGDPSVTINAMLERPGNAAFFERVFATHDRLVLDVSHAGSLPPLSVALLVLRDAPALQFAIGAALVGAVGLFARTGTAPIARLRRRDTPDFEPGRPDRETMASYLRERHPEWDDRRIDRVVDGISRRRNRRSTDE